MNTSVHPGVFRPIKNAENNGKKPGLIWNYSTLLFGLLLVVVPAGAL